MLDYKIGDIVKFQDDSEYPENKQDLGLIIEKENLNFYGAQDYKLTIVFLPDVKLDPKASDVKDFEWGRHTFPKIQGVSILIRPTSKEKFNVVKHKQKIRLIDEITILYGKHYGEKAGVSLIDTDGSLLVLTDRGEEFYCDERYCIHEEELSQSISPKLKGFLQ